MVARVWRGWTKPEDADEYASYVQAWSVGDTGYEAATGNRGAYVLQRADGERAEILILSLWESEEAIKGFLGSDVAAPILFPKDLEVLIDHDRTVVHYRVAE